MEIPEYYNMSQDVDRHATNPRKVAVRWENDQGEQREVTYRELKTASDRMAQGFLQKGLRKGDRIMILLPRIPEAYIVYLAALKAGLIVLPGSEMLQPGDITYRIQHAEVKAVVFDGSLQDRVEKAVLDCSSLQWGWIHGQKTERWESLSRLGEKAEKIALPQTRSDDIAFISYTSGTTGGPKGVIHHHSWAIPHQKVAAREWMDIQTEDTVWATAGPGWAKWVWSPFISTLGSGATSLVFHGRFNARRYLEIMETYHVNVLCCTPTEYRLMAKVENLEDYKLYSLRSAVSAGEPLNREVIDTFRKYFGVTVRDGYGQTENTLLVGTMKDMKVKPGSMGKPTPGNRVILVDPEGHPVPEGVVGDIAVHRDSPALFKGYYRDETRTANTFRGEWYITGDQARRDEDGYFFFEGRADDIIISSGYTIGPFEVEDALVKHPSVQECAVVASPDPIRGEVVKAFVVLKDGKTGSKDLVKELQEHVKNETAPYKYPRKLEFVQTLPKTMSGKIRRVELRQQELKQKKGNP